MSKSCSVDLPFDFAVEYNGSAQGSDYPHYATIFVTRHLSMPFDFAVEYNGSAQGSDYPHYATIFVTRHLFMPFDLLTLSQIVLQTLTLFVMLVGLFGLIVPVFPGLTVMWLAALGYAIVQAAAHSMTWVDWLLFILITLLMIGGNVVDNIIIAKKMLGHKIPWTSIILSYIAGIAASFFFTPLIGLAASPLALLGAEYLRLRVFKDAVESTKVYMIGWGSAFAARFAIGSLMIVFWMLWAFL
jgi:hypothetical protein